MNKTSLKHALQKIGDWIIPTRCYACYTTIQSTTGLCPTCWGELVFVTEPLCTSCGQPLPVSLGTQASVHCGSCLQNPLHNITMRSAVIYNNTSKKLILRFKHGDQQELAKFFASRLIQTAPTWFHEAAIITSVPLHWRRLWKRKFNQAALITRMIHRHMKPQNPDLYFMPTLLRRQYPTPYQGHMSRVERQENVRRAFCLDGHCTSLIQQKNVILIDDVYTTGATVKACCDILLKAGARQVQVLTFARVTTIN